MTDALIDIGANLTHQSFAGDLDAVLTRAAAAGVGQLVVTGADLASSRQAAALAAARPGTLHATAGVHPHHATSDPRSERQAFLELLAMPQVVAAGECGLDYYRDLSPRPEQRRAFAAQLEFAVLARKPVFLHQRDAHGDFVAILSEFMPRLTGGVAHCFTGGLAELECYLELGLLIGVTGWVCDERRGGALREAVPRIPLDRLMVETDAPYLLPRDLSPAPASRRNEPAYLPHVVRAVATLRAAEFGAIAAATTANARRFFALPE